jgi:hypothetical protein
MVRRRWAGGVKRLRSSNVRKIRGLACTAKNRVRAQIIRWMVGKCGVNTELVMISPNFRHYSFNSTPRTFYAG